MHASHEQTRDSSAGARWEHGLLLAGFLLVGVIAVLLGPLIPELESAWGIDHAQTGSLFLVQFAASSIGAIISSLNLRRSIVAGYALAAVALVGVVFGGWPLARPSMALLGFSLGLLIAGSNLMVARKNPDSRGRALSTLNFIWGIGAVSCPLLFAVLGKSVGAFGLLAIFAILSALSSIGLALMLTDAPGEGCPVSDESGNPENLSMLILTACLIFLYVGIEMSVGGWLVTLSDQLSVERSVVSLIIGSGFWGALLTGRGLAAIILRRLAEPPVYGMSLAIALAGSLMLFLAESRVAVAAGGILAGLGLAALYPLTVSILARVTESRARVAGPVMAFGGFGGALLPWLTGRLSQAGDAAVASLSRGFLVPIVGLGIMAALYLTYQAARRRSHARAAPDAGSP